MKPTKFEITGRYLIYAVLILLSLSALYPFWHVIMYSLSDSKAAMTGGFFLWPRNFSFSAYALLLKTPQILTAYWNTIMRTALGVAINLAMTATLAYPLSIRRFRLRGFLSMAIFFTMLFSGGMIPSFLLVRDLKLLDTMWSLLLPGAISAYNLFIMRNYFQSLPPSLEESANLDGASPLRILVSIVLPLSTPVLAALGMFYGVWHWNSYFDCILFINKPEKQVLQVYLRNILTITAFGSTVSADDRALSSGMSEETMRMATIAASVLPIVLIYPWLQKYYVKGVLIGSIKG